MSAAQVHNGSTYTNHGCRCEECRAGHAANVARRRAERAALLTADRTLATHGSNSTYVNWGCRCEPCRLAHNALRAKYGREQRRRRTT